MNDYGLSESKLFDVYLIKFEGETYRLESSHEKNICGMLSESLGP